MLHIRPQKRFGQHFVVDSRIIRKIIAAAELEPEDVVMEIGAGLGSLTFALAERTCKVYAIEIDPLLAEALEEEKGKNSKIEIIQADALKLDFASLVPKGSSKKIKVVANLPYEISSPMVFRLLEERERFSLFVLMFQKEVARRIVARPGTKDYGPLSIWTQLYCDARILFPVSRGAFFPPPKVDSAVVKFNILEKPRLPVEDPCLFGKIVRCAFTYRRKTMANALKMGPGQALPLEKIIGELKAAGIDPAVRGEALSLDQFHALSGKLSVIL